MRLDPRAPADLQSVALPGKPVSVGYDPDAHLALTGTLNNTVCVIDLDAMRVIREIPTRGGPDPVYTVELS